ncbi:MAG: porin family protein [Syntrophobacteraceae bacterium]|nr:porin family protein [Syntrophobacteraceae bacterium]
MKSFLKIFLLAAAVIVVCSQAVRAGDAIACDWTGFYFGAHLGGGFSSTHMDLHDFGITFNLHPDPGGLSGGGQIGYNLQRGPFVLGLEADVSGSAMSGSDQYSSPPGVIGGPSVVASQDINWFGTLRPRLGYTPIPRLLIYATGGVAYGDVSYYERKGFPYPATFGPGTDSGLRAGWTVGGGVEYKIARSWSMKAEYLFCDLGDQSVTAISSTLFIPLTTTVSTAGFSTEFSVFEVGLNYSFD